MNLDRHICSEHFYLQKRVKADKRVSIERRVEIKLKVTDLTWLDTQRQQDGSVKKNKSCDQGGADLDKYL